MSPRKLLIWPNALLNEVSKPVDLAHQQSEEFQRLLEEMFTVMYTAGGVGLAAIQIGVPLRVFITDISGDEQNLPCAYINPSITEWVGAPVAIEEGCLSLPGVREQAMRHSEVALTWRDRNGYGQTARLRGLEAQCAQHEMEHLDGKIFVDGAGPMKRDLMRRKIRKTLRERGE